MNQLPTLPFFKDGALMIDNSTMELFATCNRAFYYNAVKRRELDATRAALNFGTQFHSAMEWRYKTFGQDLTGENSENIAEYGVQLMRANPNPLDDYRNDDYMRDVLRAYCASNQSEPFTVVRDSDGQPIVERPFAIPLGQIHHRDLTDPVPVIWTGRVDLLVQWQDGTMSTLDHKTSSMGGESYFDEYLNSQPQIGYLWAARKAFNTKLNTFIINATFVRKPAKTVTAKGTTFDRKRFYVPEDKITEWETNVMEQCYDVVDKAVRGVFPMTTKSCVGKYGRCQYIDVCGMPPSSREGALASGLFRDVTWNPLH